MSIDVFYLVTVVDDANTRGGLVYSSTSANISTDPDFEVSYLKVIMSTIVEHISHYHHLKSLRYVHNYDRLQCTLGA